MRETAWINLTNMLTTASITTDRQRKRAYLRLRPQLVERLRTEANKRHTSFNSYVEGILYDAVFNEPNAETIAAIEESRRGEYAGFSFDSDSCPNNTDDSLSITKDSKLSSDKLERLAVADFSAEQVATLQEARKLTPKAIRDIEEQEFCSPEDLRLLLYRTVDDIYMKTWSTLSTATAERISLSSIHM